VNGEQEMSKQRGSDGKVNGVQLAAFGMGQQAANNCAVGCQGSLILGGQASCIDGTAQGVATVATGMVAIVVQAQVANDTTP
jgi:hypothetical protein